MMPQQIILQPLGLITQPNKLGAMPVGALSQADRALMRDPGTIEVAPAWETKSLTRTAVMGYVIPIGTSLIWFTTTTGLATCQYGWYTQSTGFNTFAPADLVGENSNPYLVDHQGRFGFVIARDRAFLQCRAGQLVFDYASPQFTGEKTPRISGLPVPLVFSTLPSLNPGTEVVGALPPETGAHYTVVHRRTFADGYTIRSAPSAAWHAYNISPTASASVVIQVVQPSSVYMKPGDVIEIYRTLSQPIDVVNTGGNNTNTGSDYYRVASYEVTAASPASIFIRENVTNDNVGEPLYTNQGLKTAAAMAFPAPTSASIASYKGYTFYGNVTSPPSFSFRVPGKWGEMFLTGSPTAATVPVRRAGLGYRSFTGTATAASPTVTGVNPNDIVGLAIGQLVIHDVTPRWTPTAGQSIVAIGATSVTLSTNASSSGTTEIRSVEILEIDGIAYEIPNVARLLQENISYQSDFIGRVLGMTMLDRVYPTGVNAAYAGTIPADKVTLSRTYASPVAVATPLLVRATNGQNYDPPLPGRAPGDVAKSFAAEVSKNKVVWSELNQPEYVPLPNYAFVGRGEIYQMYSTRDAIWIFASDGLWRLSGTGGSVGPEGYDWRVDPVDSTLILAGPQAGCVYRDTVYALTTRGFVSVTSDGSVSQISSGRIDDIMPPVADWSLPTQYTQANAITVEADPFHNEIWIRFPPVGTDVGRLFVYSVFADAFTNDIVSNLNGDTGDGVQWFFYLPSARSIYATYALNSAQQWLIAPTLGPALGMELKYQPLVAEEPFGMHHWQVLDVSVQLVGPTSVIARAYGNNNVSLDIGTRTFAGTDESEYARLGWGIPRNVPAVANAFAPRLSMGGSATVGHRIKLQGVAITFEAMTIQRKKR